MASPDLRVSPIIGSSAALLFIGTIAGFFLGRWSALKTASIDQSPGVDLDEDNNKEFGHQSNTSFIQDEEFKLVLVVRTDLGMTKGKIAAQCSHATLACYKALLKQEARAKSQSDSFLSRWESTGQAKVTVQARGEEELLILQAQAMSLDLCAKVIHDAGRTQIASGSTTVLGVGPGPKSIVDQVTGSLKLL